MSTKRQKRRSRQVRISVKWHRIFKIESAENDQTMSKYLNEFFEKKHPKGKLYEHDNSK